MYYITEYNIFLKILAKISKNQHVKNGCTEVHDFMVNCPTENQPYRARPLSGSTNCAWFGILRPFWAKSFPLLSIYVI